MDVKDLIAFVGVLAGAFKAFTSGLKDLQDIREKKKRRPRPKKRR